MVHKILIVVFFIGILASLARSFFFLMHDQGDPDKRRIQKTLGFRVLMAIGLMLTIAHGIYSGVLMVDAPWHGQIHQSSQP